MPNFIKDIAEIPLWKEGEEGQSTAWFYSQMADFANNIISARNPLYYTGSIDITQFGNPDPEIISGIPFVPKNVILFFPANANTFNVRLYDPSSTGNARDEAFIRFISEYGDAYIFYGETTVISGQVFQVHHGVGSFSISNYLTGPDGSGNYTITVDMVNQATATSGNPDLFYIITG